MTKTLNDHLSEAGAVPTLGTLLSPLFHWRGKDFYPVFGAEGDDDGDDTGGEAGDDDDDTDDGEDTGKKDGERPVTREEFDRLRNQLSKADKNKAAAEKKLKDLEDAKKDDLTKATDQVAELTKAREADAKVMGELRMQNAFLTADTGITWHDPADALALAEKKGYLAEVVDDDGNVDDGKLATKLKEFAKAKPHMVKKGTDGDDDSDGKAAAGATTGGKVGSGSKKKPDKDDKSLPAWAGSLLR